MWSKTLNFAGFLIRTPSLQIKINNSWLSAARSLSGRHYSVLFLTNIYTIFKNEFYYFPKKVNENSAGDSSSSTANDNLTCLHTQLHSNPTSRNRHKTEYANQLTHHVKSEQRVLKFSEAIECNSHDLSALLQFTLPKLVVQTFLPDICVFITQKVKRIL